MVVSNPTLRNEHYEALREEIEEARKQSNVAVSVYLRYTDVFTHEDYYILNRVRKNIEDALISLDAHFNPVVEK